MPNPCIETTRAVENLVTGLDGKPLRWCVNPEVYPS